MYLTLDIFHPDSQQARFHVLYSLLSHLFTFQFIYFKSLNELQCFSFMQNIAGPCELWKEGITEVPSIIRDTSHLIVLYNILTRAWSWEILCTCNEFFAMEVCGMQGASHFFQKWKPNAFLLLGPVAGTLEPWSF